MFKFKIRNLVWVLVIVLTTTACKQNNNSESDTKLPLPTVKVGSPVVQDKIVYEHFRAVSRYLQDVNFRSRTEGVVTKVFTRPGDEIRVGQPLFIIKPVELTALEKSGSLSKGMYSSSDTIYSDQNALTNMVSVQEGDYVQPGSLLASAFKKNSLVAMTYIPFNKVPSIKKNTPCSVIIPGQKPVDSYFKRPLFIADTVTQTQPFIVPLPSNLQLSAGMNLQVSFKEREIHQGIFVPRDAVLTNEEETSFWLMKMTNDTTAVKVPVTVGLLSEKNVEILSGAVKPGDRIVTQGAYGLPDTAYVKIVK
ncbi:MAG: hypothetical protein IH595_12705 [Bacteroidales bacterium]|nr:hypothetical protein [Bacteroidales bacterium]